MKQLRKYQQEAVIEAWAALKANDDPVLLLASVGAGKSLMIANILLTIQRQGKRALCIVNNAELVRNNCATFKEQGGYASIYCAALKSKDVSAPIVFGTPQSILNGINKHEAIKNIKFNLIVVDEAHAINYINDRSCFIRILRHFKQEYRPMRVLGATGTNFRFKGNAIVGKKCLFKSQVGNITTEQLINDCWLIEPIFKVDSKLLIDFSKVKIKKNSQFDQKQLAEVVNNNTRLTELICKQIIHIMQSQRRFGIFIFATTKKHAYEIMSHLPPNESAIILGEKKEHERISILNKARIGTIKYLVNITIISVGVDVPAYDTLAYLRPTESLVLLVQTMGRALRLSAGTNKREALILDFAGNIQRHQDWDNPILLQALQQIDSDKPRVIQCPECNELNTEHARRCVGIMNNGKRCEYFFEFKECIKCKVKNDISSRQCRECHTELIDPDAKLSLDLDNPIKEVEVLKAKYTITGTETSFRLHCNYLCTENVNIYEWYTPISDKARMVFYGQFISKHCDNPSDWYLHMGARSKMEHMLQIINTPSQLMLIENERGYKIKRKIF